MSDVTSDKSGDWAAPTTWDDSKVPKPSDHVTIRSADVVTLEANAKGNELTVDGKLSGHGKIAAPIVDGNGTIEASGGTLDVKGAVENGPGIPSALSFVIDANSTLEFDGLVSSATTVTFDGASAALDLTHEGKGETAFQATVKGFAIGDQIDLKGTNGDTVAFDAGTDQLTVNGKNGTETIQLAGNGYSADNVHLTTIGGVDIITTTATCFMAGTLIRTPKGEVPVETLERGDLVVTTDSVAKPVTWLGRQTISTVFADPRRVWPIRIKAGAIEDNVPARDLVVSPGHAIYIDGALILASALVNGTSVVREAIVPKVFTYYHIELDEHSLVYAENTPAESFVDNVERLAFNNWAEHEALYPEGKTIVELPYPVAKSQRQVPVEIRVKLGERAHRIGASIVAAVA